MIWARFPHRVKFGGVFYASNADIPASDDDLARLEAMGAKIVRAVYTPEPDTERKTVSKAKEEPTKAPVKETRTQQVAAPKRKGRKPKNA